jgi:hypothetical protein
LRQGKKEIKKRNKEKKIRLSTLTRPATSSSRYRELYNQAQALMQAIRNMKK